MRTYRRGASFVFSIVASLTWACGDESNEPNESENPDNDVTTVTVSGAVVDFLDATPLEGATVSTDGLSPAPTVSVTGSEFKVEGVAPFSTFHLLGSSPPDYRSTYNAVIEVGDADLPGVTLVALSEDYIDGLYSDFGVTPSNGTSLILAELIDADGNPASGIPAAAFDLPEGMSGPHFLDADREAAPELGSSSESGYVVFFEVQPGLISLSAKPDSGYAMTMADSPVAERAATLATISVINGEIEVPTGVSFSQDVVPIFSKRGCDMCHDGGGIGKDLGGLHLNGAADKMYKEIVQEISGNLGKARVDLETPEASAILTYPSREDPPDGHPNSTFLSGADPDYLMILGWIKEGALQN
jgi:hypothetical protein